jgi:hypothetical protein
MFGSSVSTVLRTACDETQFSDPEYEDLKNDLVSMRTVIRLFKQSDLNSLLPDGETLFPEVETRFHHSYDVTTRFLKSTPSVTEISHLQGSDHLYETLKRLDAEVIDGYAHYPNLSALVDVMGPFAEGIVRLQSSSIPTMHMVCPYIVT